MTEIDDMCAATIESSATETKVQEAWKTYIMNDDIAGSISDADKN